MSFTHRITPEDIRRADTNDMAVHIARMAQHLREAVSMFNEAWSAGAKQLATPKGIIVLGMGGSAIGGDLLRAYLPSLPIPFVVNRSYDLPAGANETMLVIASSYSGNTEETLSSFEQAVAKKIPIVCLTTGGTLAERATALGFPLFSSKPGMQPRAALAFSFVPILLLLEKLGLTQGEEAKIERTATLLEKLAERYGPNHLDDSNLAFKQAGDLLHRIPVIYAPQDYEAVALRWRGQIHENAKHVAFSNVLPEMNHNELEGWSHPIDLVQHFSVVLLRTSDEHERISRRYEAIHDIFRSKQVDVFEISAEGETRLERLFSLIALADWTSLYMALFSGLDPTAIATIEAFKQKMR